MNKDQGIGCMPDREEILVQSVKDLLQHRIYNCQLQIVICKFLNALNARDSHVLRDLNGICAPWGDHLFPGTDEGPVQNGFGDTFRIAEKPVQFINICDGERFAGLNGIDPALFSEKGDHNRNFNW